MIQIHRGPEPKALADARDKYLPKLRQIVAGGGEPRSTDITGYNHKDIKDALYKAQHWKCCYCEKQIEKTHEAVEHFRPKAQADRRPGSNRTHGYWWLAFSWENLLYACRQCNERPAKGIRFPMAVGSTPLAAEQAPPGLEKCLLLDPAVENGVKHIQFRPRRRGARDRWIPEPRNNSDCGSQTIKVCLLDRDPLLDYYNRHVVDYVMPQVENIRAAMAKNNPRDVYEAVVRAGRRLLRANQLFVGLSYDALVHFVPDDRLSRWDLSWPMPT